jgi:hypothetical protein
MLYYVTTATDAAAATADNIAVSTDNIYLICQKTQCTCAFSKIRQQSVHCVLEQSLKSDLVVNQRSPCAYYLLLTACCDSTTLKHLLLALQ